MKLEETETYKHYKIVKHNNQYGIINLKNNTLIVDYVFDYIDWAEYAGVVVLKKNKKYAFHRLADIENLHITKKDIDFQFNQYLFFDTETTGVPQNYDAPISDLQNWPRLVQLSWILCDQQGNDIETGNDIVKPNGFIIPEAASKVHQITTIYAIETGADLSTVLNKFISVSKQAKYLVGHNVSFDINVVGAELLRIKSDYSIANKDSIDTMLKSINYCAIPSGLSYGDKYKWPKLQELHKKLFGYEFEDAHDAMADIRATKKCFFEMKRIGLITE